MKKVISINLLEGYEFNLSCDDYYIELSCDPNINIKSFCENNEDEIRTMIENEKECNIEFAEIDGSKYDTSLIDEILQQKINFHDNISELTIQGKSENIINFLKNNKEIFTKKLYINNILGFEDSNNVNMIYFINNCNNYEKCSLTFGENENYTDITDCIKSTEIIETIKNKVLKYNFSPFEQLMYVYDIVREKIYTQEDINDDYQTSRGLSNVLLGDKIVCAGYVNVFNTIIKRLGFKCNEMKLKRTEKFGHSRSVVYVKDEKYDIDGVYFFDPTFDSKYDEINNDYLLSYNYFSNTMDEMIEKDKENKFKYDYSLSIFPVEFSDFIANFNKKLKHNAVGMPPNYRKTYNSLAELIDDSNVTIPIVSELMPDTIIEKALNKANYNDKVVLENFKRYIKAVTTKITPEIFLKALFEVRKIEYYEEPEKFPFSTKTFYKTSINTKRNFESDAGIRLLNAIFGEDYTGNIKTFNSFKEEIELDKKVEQVKLAKTLRKVLEKKENSN